jgi:hypothetical protein
MEAEAQSCSGLKWDAEYAKEQRAAKARCESKVVSRKDAKAQSRMGLMWDAERCIELCLPRLGVVEMYAKEQRAAKIKRCVAFAYHFGKLSASLCSFAIFASQSRFALSATCSPGHPVTSPPSLASRTRSPVHLFTRSPSYSLTNFAIAIP